MQVFISWRGCDLEIKNKVVAALRETLDSSQDTVFESEAGCSSDATDEYMKALLASQIFIYIVSDESNENPRLCYDEIIQAHDQEMDGKLNMMVFKVTDAPYTPRLAGHLSHVSDSNRVGLGNGTEQGYKELAEKAKRLLDLRRFGCPEKPNDVTKPKFKGIPITSGYFVEGSRDKQIKELDELFSEDNIVFLEEFNGFGKKSLAKKYAELHKDDYEILYLNSFSGTLKDFFLSGLEVKNIGDKAFDGLEVEEIVEKKADLLNKLESATLFIVPQIDLNKDLDPYLDYLRGLKPSFIFITETVPKKVEDSFKCLKIGRMENEHLKDLFYHYYEEKPDNELDSALEEFICKVEGHTKAVELAATTLNEECFIDNDEASTALRSISINSDDELGAKIMDAISGLFNLANISDTERKIMYFFALLGPIGVTKYEIKDFLNELGIYDNKALKHLLANRWINEDPYKKIFAMDDYLSLVLLNKLQIRDEEIESVVYEELSTQFLVLLPLQHISTFSLARFLEYIGLEELGYILFSLYEILEDKSYSDRAESIIQQLEELKKSYTSKIPKSLYGETEILIRNLIGVAKARILRDKQFIDNPTENFNDIEVLKNAMNLLPESEQQYLSFLINQINELDDYSSLTRKLIHFFESSLDNTDDNDDSAVFVYMLQTFSPLIFNNKDKISNYLFVSFLKAFSKYSNENYTIPSLAYICNYYLTSHYAEELDLKNMLLCLVKAEEEYNRLDQTAREKNLFYTIPIVDSINAFIEMGLDEYALNIYEKYKEQLFENSVDISSLVENIALCINKEKGKEEAIAFLDNEIEIFKDTLDYDYFVSLKDVLNGTESNSQVIESKYIDYYETFNQTFSDKLSQRKYEKVISKIHTYDFSALDKTALREAFVALEGKTENLEFLPKAIAIASEAIFRTLGYRLHDEQYLASLAMLDGKLAEVRNGEGKTDIIAITSAIKVLMGKGVHIIDSSEYLTKRNATKMNPFFTYLGIGEKLLSDSLSFDSNCDSKLLEKEVSYIFCDTMVFDFMRAELRTNQTSDKMEVAIIDEIDVVLSNINKQYSLTSNDIANKVEASLIKNIYDYVTSLIASGDISKNKYGCYMLNDSAQMQINMHFSKNLISSDILNEIISCVLEVCSWDNKNEEYYHMDEESLRPFFEDRVEGIYKSFKPLNETIILLKEGYREIRDVLLNNYTNKMYLGEALLPYEEILGTSATLSSFRDAYKKYFNFDIFPIKPHVESRRVDYPATICTSYKIKLEELLNLVSLYKKNRQPILIITRDVNECEKVSVFLKENNFYINVLNAKNADDGTDILERCGKLDCITVTTTMANRGVDIKLGGAANNEKERISCEAEKRIIENAGGLVVIITECFASLQQEEQARGRCGRQGSPGITHALYALDDKCFKSLRPNGFSFLGIKQDEGVLTDGNKKTILHRAIIKSRIRGNSRDIEQLSFSFIPKERTRTRTIISSMLKTDSQKSIDLIGDYLSSNPFFTKEYEKLRKGEEVKYKSLKELAYLVDSPYPKLFLDFYKNAINSFIYKANDCLKQDYISLADLNNMEKIELNKRLSALLPSLLQLEEFKMVSNLKKSLEGANSMIKDRRDIALASLFDEVLLKLMKVNIRFNDKLYHLENGVWKSQC